jgi:dihydroorotate dehydrogenase
METEEENTINPWGSHHPPDASTIAAMAAGNPQIQQIYKSFLDEMEKYAKPVSIAVAVNEEFSYNKETDTIYTTVDALGKHFDTRNAKNTTIELYNPATGGQRTFTWRHTHDTGAKSTMHYEYRANHDGRWINLCVWFHSVKNLSA